MRYFCDNAQAVLFLTATPVQLGSEDLYTLLNVLRPDLVIDQASFEQMAEPNRYINAAVQLCRAAREGWQHEARAQLEAAAQTEWGRSVPRGVASVSEGVTTGSAKTRLDDADRVSLTRAIEELYTFSPLINRTRRRDIGEFTTRKPETVTRDFTPDAASAPRRAARRHRAHPHLHARPAERQVHDDDDSPAGGQLSLRAGAAAPRHAERQARPARVDGSSGRRLRR